MNTITYIIERKLIFSLLFIAALFCSCDDFGKYELPEAGSIPDKTPPSASFSYTQGEGEDYLTYSFANQSASAIDYMWDFGDGNTSGDVEGKNTYPDTGSYTVTLLASDALGVSSTYSETIRVGKPEAPSAIIPDILEGGFEDNSLPDGSGDGRDSWRCSFGEIMQITSSPVHSGSQASKFPSDGGRVAYQELTVSPNVDYVLTYYYTMKTDGAGSITVRVMDGPISELPTDDSNVLASFTGDDQTDANAFVEATIVFNTGANETIALLVTNEGVECRLDDFSIDVVN